MLYLGNNDVTEIFWEDLAMLPLSVAISLFLSVCLLSMHAAFPLPFRKRDRDKHFVGKPSRVS